MELYVRTELVGKRPNPETKDNILKTFHLPVGDCVGRPKSSGFIIPVDG